MNKYITADILDRYISLIINSFFPEAKQIRNGNYNFRCNVCGDSKKRKNKKRAWILKFPDKWIFYCHNCNESMVVEHWMKIYFNVYFNDYLKEAFKIDAGYTKPLPTPIKKEELNDEEYNEYKDVQYFKPIFSSNDELFLIARKICLSRLIPIDIWSKWYVAIDGRYANRLVIPYYDDNHKIYNYQCRSLSSQQEPKYLSKINSTDNIYNYYCVDTTKPVIILEGVIDSLFIENSIACSGLRVEDERFKKFPHRYFLLDNDEPGRAMNIKLLKEKEYVFNWKNFLYDKKINTDGDKDDINSIILKMKKNHKFTFDELKLYFVNGSSYITLFNPQPMYNRNFYLKGENKYERYNSQKNRFAYS